VAAGTAGVGSGIGTAAGTGTGTAGVGSGALAAEVDEELAAGVAFGFEVISTMNFLSSKFSFSTVVSSDSTFPVHRY